MPPEFWMRSGVKLESFHLKEWRNTKTPLIDSLKNIYIFFFIYCHLLASIKVWTEMFWLQVHRFVGVPTV